MCGDIPDREIDTTAEFLEVFLRNRDDLDIDTILKNSSSVNDSDILKTVGYHEGAHCEEHDDSKTKLDILKEEARADRVALKKLAVDNRADVGLFFSDIVRDLLSGDSSYHGNGFYGNTDIVHATGPVLYSGDDIREHHLRVATNYKVVMDDIVQRKVTGVYDWKDHEHNEAKELLKDDPDAYFAIVNKHIDKINQRVLRDYNETVRTKPEDIHIDTWSVIDAQTFANYAHNYEDAYRRRMLGQDIEDRDPTVLISQEEVAKYYKEEERIEAETSARIQKEIDDATEENSSKSNSQNTSANDKNYDQGINGTAYTTHVSNIPTGDVKVKFAGDSTGIMVGDNSAPDIFNSHSNPPFENISIVDAKIENDIDQKLDLPQDAKNDAIYQNQNFA